MLAASLAAAAIPGFPDYSDYAGKPMTIDYDKRALTINGDHVLFLSGAVHPPRGTPDMWDEWLATARRNGLNMVQVCESLKGNIIPCLGVETDFYFACSPPHRRSLLGYGCAGLCILELS